MPSRHRPPPHRAIAPLLLAVAGLLTGCGDRPAVHVLEGRTMGTTYHVQLVDPEPDRDSLRRAIEAELASLDRQLSTWRQDSDIARFNQLRSQEWVALPPALGNVLERSLQLNRSTEGALDPTLRPLSLAWGFQGDGAARVPDDAVIENLLTRSGAGLIELQHGPGGLQARKRDPGVEIDLSALAKGYAVDRLAARLEAAGGRNFLVEIGGEVRAAGGRPDGTPWRVGLERPDGTTKTFVLLQDEAIATSGDYRNYLEVDGVRYAHVLDPRTGRPVDHATAVATVIADDTMTADGLATAFLVLSPERALALADELGVALHLQLRTNEGFETQSNAAFHRHLR